MAPAAHRQRKPNHFGACSLIIHYSDRLLWRVLLTSLNIPASHTVHTHPPRKRHWRSSVAQAEACWRHSQSDSLSPSPPIGDHHLSNGPQLAACDIYATFSDRLIQQHQIIPR